MQSVQPHQSHAPQSSALRRMPSGEPNIRDGNVGAGEDHVWMGHLLAGCRTFSLSCRTVGLRVKAFPLSERVKLRVSQEDGEHLKPTFKETNYSSPYPYGKPSKPQRMPGTMDNE